MLYNQYVHRLDFQNDPALLSNMRSAAEMWLLGPPSAPRAHVGITLHGETEGREGP